MTTLPDVHAIIDKLELTPPDVYVHGTASLPDSKGVLRSKRCIINLATGDVFKNRKLEWAESQNAYVPRERTRAGRIIAENFGFRNAVVVDDNVILLLWVFADHIGQPNTAELKFSYYETEIPQNRLKPAINESALFSIEIARPKIAAMVLVDKNKEVFSWSDTEHFGSGINGRLTDHYLANVLTAALRESSAAGGIVGLTEAFRDVFKMGYVGANKYVHFDHHKEVALFMRASKLTKKSTKGQTKVDELASQALPNHSTFGEHVPAICYADRVNDEWVVLRWYKRSDNSAYTETSRMYVNKTDALNCRSDLQGGWVHSPAKLKAVTFNADKIIMQSEDVFNGTKLEYFKSVVSTMPNQSATLYMLTTYPEFEKFCKMGLDWLCKGYLINPYQTSWRNYLEDAVGEVDASAKNPLKFLGINQHQAVAFTAFVQKMLDGDITTDWHCRCVLNVIRKLKRMFHVSALNSIDNETFDFILGSLEDKERLFGFYADAVNVTFKLYPKDALYFVKDLLKAMDGADHITVVTEYGYRSSMSVERMYYDVLRMIDSGAYGDVLRPRFASVDELVGHHSIMVDLINADAKRNAARIEAKYAAGFETNKDKWKTFEWNEDDTYCVVAPTQPVDVAIEGVTLRHCVKSYIPALASGSTNVLFIRKKDDEKTPFFTVEVDSRNTIRQVHGMCNCNVDSVEGLLDFVAKWAKSKKLKYSKEYADRLRVAE